MRGSHQRRLNTFAPSSRVCRAYASCSTLTAPRSDSKYGCPRRVSTKPTPRVESVRRIRDYRGPGGDLRGLEVVGRDAVEELLELFDLVLTNRTGGLFVGLVGDQQTRLGQHGLLD